MLRVRLSAAKADSMGILPSLPTLCIFILAVWRVTHLLWGEDGPFDVFARLRGLAGTGVVGRMLDCFYCLSVWVALPLAYTLSTGWPERALLWASLSGGAILLERATTRPAPPPPAQWHETTFQPRDKEKEDREDGMLR